MYGVCKANGQRGVTYVHCRTFGIVLVLCCQIWFQHGFRHMSLCFEFTGGRGAFVLLLAENLHVRYVQSKRQRGR